MKKILWRDVALCLCPNPLLRKERVASLSETSEVPYLPVSREMPFFARPLFGLMARALL